MTPADPYDTPMPSVDRLASKYPPITDAQRQAGRSQFAVRANQFTQAARALLEEWERCEMQTGDTPSDVAGYPFTESFDELLLAILEWNWGVQEWAYPEKEAA